ncbi:hypothetical protein ACFPM7_02980 [Actinokineospora guangxiensis]|uniref:Uncharacterized protein n=1 Tax=Actinokineospora guangxiensis TaxID=1490288 RepID=A0ABW0EJB2_9PSEU
MPLWLWIVIVVVAVLGLLYLALLPQRRARRGLADSHPMPSRDARRADATALDPHTIATRQSGPNTGTGPF